MLIRYLTALRIAVSAAYDGVLGVSPGCQHEGAEYPLLPGAASASRLRVRQEHHDRAGLGGVSEARHRRGGLPGGDVLRGVEGGVDPATPFQLPPLRVSRQFEFER